MNDLVLTPSDFVALVNQTLEFAYPIISIEGELSSFRVSRNRWVYFDLKDENSSVSCFGTVYQLPGPLEDGMMVRATGSPRLHNKFGFSFNIQSILPVGEGALKKAADLLRAKLEKEGLFALERKRALPAIPRSIGLITAASSAAAADFMKITGERWGGLEILLADTLVQGEQAPAQLVGAIEKFSKMASPPEVLVITRGGGSVEDLAAFNDERVVRAVAASRVPTLVAIGHEVDTSLAELAADVRASTPTNAAQILLPDKSHELVNLEHIKKSLSDRLLSVYQDQLANLKQSREYLTSQVNRLIDIEEERLNNAARLVRLFDPAAALRRGYAMVFQEGRLVKTTRGIKSGTGLSVELADGKLSVKVEKVAGKYGPAQS